MRKRLLAGAVLVPLLLGGTAGAGAGEAEAETLLLISRRVEERGDGLVAFDVHGGEPDGLVEVGDHYAHSESLFRVNEAAWLEGAVKETVGEPIGSIHSVCTVVGPLYVAHGSGVEGPDAGKEQCLSTLVLDGEGLAADGDQASFLNLSALIDIGQWDHFSGHTPDDEGTVIGGGGVLAGATGSVRLFGPSESVYDGLLYEITFTLPSGEEPPTEPPTEPKGKPANLVNIDHTFADLRPIGIGLFCIDTAPPGVVGTLTDSDEPGEVIINWHLEDSRGPEVISEPFAQSTGATVVKAHLERNELGSVILGPEEIQAGPDIKWDLGRIEDLVECHYGRVDGILTDRPIALQGTVHVHIPGGIPAPEGHHSI